MKTKFFVMLLMAVGIGFLSCNPQNEPNDGQNGNQTENSDDYPKESNISTGDIIELSETGATLSGNILVDISNYQSIEFGILFSDNKTELEQYKGTKQKGTELNGNSFSVSITDLWQATSYYYRAYIYLNNMQYYYGNIKSFETKEITYQGFKVAENKYITFAPGNLVYYPSDKQYAFKSEQYYYNDPLAELE